LKAGRSPSNMSSNRLYRRSDVSSRIIAFARGTPTGTVSRQRRTASRSSTIARPGVSRLAFVRLLTVCTRPSPPAASEPRLGRRPRFCAPAPGGRDQCRQNSHHHRIGRADARSSPPPLLSANGQRSPRKSIKARGNAQTHGDVCPVQQGSKRPRWRRHPSAHTCRWWAQDARLALDQRCSRAEQAKVSKL
jgi:hypothetical protein